MSSHTTKLLHDRVRVDKDALARVDLRLETVHRAYAEAQERLLDAQRAAEALASEARELQSAKQALANSLATTRCALLRDAVARLPDDIWRCVFDESVQEQQSSRRAFILARVSARWRRIVLSTPCLWSRIRFSSGNTINAKLLEATELMLFRSGACLLHIFVYFDIHPDEEQRLQAIHDIILALSRHAQRWGVVRLMLPDKIGTGPLAMLKGPTPKLVLLSIMLDSLHEESGYLPYAPMLESLTLTNTNMTCSAFATYPALTRTWITSSRRGTPLHHSGFIYRARESLEKIEIDALVEHSAGMNNPLLLPRLRTLVLKGSFYRPNAVPAVTLLATPRLTHLHLDMLCEILPALRASFLEAVSSTVRTLRFSRNLSAAGLERLQHLHNVEEVEFGYSVDEAAFAALASHVPTIWPRLAIMDLRRHSEACGDALIKLVASRNLSHVEGAVSSEPPRPCRLREVILSSDAPRWVSAEVERLLAL